MANSADKRNVFTTMRGNGCVRHCAHCKTTVNFVEWSTRLQCYICDGCYEKIIPVVNGEARDK